MGNKKQRQKKVEYRGDIFICVRKGDKVAVRIQRTAHGQTLLVGTFDTQDHSWQNESRGSSLPSVVKHEIEAAFA